MDCPLIPMSFDEFETIEHLLGWKTEYWDGYAHLTPRCTGVETRLSFDSVSRLAHTVPKRITLIPLTLDYTQHIIDGYIDAFINSVEFCGWPTDSIFEEAHRDISLYFEGKRGEPLSASVIALEPTTKMVVATALVTNKKEQGACLELLYVRPSRQRTGIGTSIIYRIIHALARQGHSQLTSRYHICNYHSRQFYHKIGFQDVCDRYYLRTYIAWLRNNIHRRETLKMLDSIEEMRQEQKQLQEKLEVLEEEFTQSIREAVRESSFQER